MEDISHQITVMLILQLSRMLVNLTESPKHYFQLFTLLSEIPLSSPDSEPFPGNGIIAPCSEKNAHKRP
jgi:hypothetical protein